MYPKNFFEQFWEGEQKNELFVGIAFNDFLEFRFTLIDKVAKSLKFDRSHRVGLDAEANSITDKIFDGIANSKMILFDLSDDPRKNNQINPNVIYELGIANAIREPFDIILIRKDTEKTVKLPFDIQGLNVNSFDEEINEEFLKKIISSALENQQWHKSKRVRIAAQSVDDIGLDLMYKLGWKPQNNHFNSSNFTATQKMSVLRLIDLGIIRTDWAIWKPYGKGYEMAYWWTSFGREVMKHIGIEQMSMEDYMKIAEYQEDLKRDKEFTENKKKQLS